MAPQFRLKLAALTIAVALLVAAFYAWRTDSRDRAQLAAELAATKQLLTAADARQRDRDAQLAQTLATLTAEKRSIVTPAQIVGELQKNFALPAPIILQPGETALVGAHFSASPTPSPQPAFAEATPGSPSTNAADASKSGARLRQQPGSAPASPTNDKSAPGQAVLPSADLKPLFDFTLDCQACQAKLSAAQGDLVDERQKTAALTKERDDALRIAKGGSSWRRMGRAAKWFLIGAAAGALVAKTR